MVIHTQEITLAKYRVRRQNPMFVGDLEVCSGRGVNTVEEAEAEEVRRD